MSDKKRQREDLKVFAGKACLDIFNDYIWEEVCNHCPPSVQKAWEIGKALANLE